MAVAKTPSAGSWRYLLFQDVGRIDQWTCNDHEVAESRVRDRFSRYTTSPFSKTNTVAALLQELTSSGWVSRETRFPMSTSTAGSAMPLPPTVFRELTIVPAQSGGFVVFDSGAPRQVVTPPQFAGELKACLDFIEKAFTEVAVDRPDGPPAISAAEYRRL